VVWPWWFVLMSFRNSRIILGAEDKTNFLFCIGQYRNGNLK